MTVARVDTRGLYCPVPVLRTRDRLRGLSPGAILEVVADDPVVLTDMPLFCRSHGHEYLGHDRGPAGELCLRIRKGGGARGE